MSQSKLLIPLLLISLSSPVFAKSSNPDALSRCQQYFPALAKFQPVKGQGNFNVVESQKQMLAAMLAATSREGLAPEGSQVEAALFFCVSELKRNLDASRAREKQARSRFQELKSHLASADSIEVTPQLKQRRSVDPEKLQELRRRLNDVQELLEALE